MREKIVIFDNNPMIIAGLEYFLVKHQFDVAASTTNPEELFRFILFVKPDFVIVDPLLMNEDNINKLTQIKQILCELKIVIFAGSDCVFHILRSHRLNWMFYLSKNQPLDKLVHSLRNPPKNNLVVIDKENFGMISDAPRFESLDYFTNREIQVLREIGAGNTNKSIANKLNLSNKTISTYKRNIMGKLNTNDVRDVMDFARRNGF